MDKENNVVYVQTKNGIFKCYKSEQMHKPVYYPIESKTNGYIDYYDVIGILNIDDLYEQVKKQKEAIEQLKNSQYCPYDKKCGKLYECTKQEYEDMCNVNMKLSLENDNLRYRLENAIADCQLRLKELKKQKEVIDKLEKKIKVVKQDGFDKVGRYELLDILKEVSDE